MRYEAGGVTNHMVEYAVSTGMVGIETIQLASCARYEEEYMSQD